MTPNLRASPETTAGGRRRQQSALLVLATANVALVVLVQLLILTIIGPGESTDAYMAAATLPQMLAGMASIALSSVLMPILAGEPPAHQARDAWRFLLAVCGITLPLALALSLGATRWVAWLFPGFSAEPRNLCVLLAKIQIYAMPFTTLNAVAMALCYARGQFLRCEAATFVGALLALVTMPMTLPVFGIVAAACTFVVMPLLQTALLLPSFGHPSSLRGKNGTDFRMVWHRLKPLLVGNLYHRSDILIDRYLLSMSNVADMTLFSLVQQLYGALAGIIGKVWGTTAIPTLAQCHKRDDNIEFWRLYRRRLTILGLASLAAYLVLILGGRAISGLLTGQGMLSGDKLSTFWELAFFMGGMLGFCSLGVVVSGAYYALGETRLPAYLSMTSFTLFIVIKYLAFRDFGAVGVALATSAYFGLNVVMLALYLPFFARSRFHPNHAKTITAPNDGITTRHKPTNHDES